MGALLKPFIFIACSKVIEIFNLLDFWTVVFSNIRLMNSATSASIAIIFMWQSRGRQEWSVFRSRIKTSLVCKIFGMDYLETC